MSCQGYQNGFLAVRWRVRRVRCGYTGEENYVGTKSTMVCKTTWSTWKWISNHLCASGPSPEVVRASLAQAELLENSIMKRTLLDCRPDYSAGVGELQRYC